jgi:LysM repeat protein
MSKRPITKTLPKTFLPVKRRPGRKRPLKSLFAAIRGKNQRAATATAEDLEAEDRGLRISRGFTIIFAFHVVAIGLYFVHLNFLADHTDAPAAAPATPPAAAASKPRTQSGAPLIAPNDKTCKVQTGDTYERIAAREGVEVNALRAANADRPLSPDLTLILPQKRHTAGYPPALEALRNPAVEEIPKAELVDAVPADSNGIVVRPKVVRETVNATRATPATGGRSYVVKNGDNLWQISKRFKVDQAALMQANRIADPKKLKPGMTLTIPQ